MPPIMDDRDSVLFISEIKPYLIQILKITSTARNSYFSWDEENEKIAFSKKKNFVKFSIIFQLIYTIIQIYFTLEAQVTLSNKFKSSGLIVVFVLILIIRWEFEPDDAAMLTINGLLAKNLKSYNLRGKIN